MRVSNQVFNADQRRDNEADREGHAVLLHPVREQQRTGSDPDGGGGGGRSSTVSLSSVGGRAGQSVRDSCQWRTKEPRTTPPKTFLSEVLPVQLQTHRAVHLQITKVFKTAQWSSEKDITLRDPLEDSKPHSSCSSCSGR
ncbi:hypothetical protein JZ751_003243 [Albula glossodonta]|uniref:Uncharacterized protein n=1 Tax=Albula glossodonta TaxID=121402 RepID=A0A8T2NAC7_9TELE|nr:hypothetical protein JZ751_003243 [Albula glossodonta]